MRTYLFSRGVPKPAVSRCSKQRPYAKSAGFARHGDVAAHHLTEAPTDGEAKPGSAVFARRCRGGLRKLLEQLAHLFRCHSDAGISNRNRNPIAAVLLSLTRIDADGAALSEFVGIAHEVQQRLAQAHLVGLHSP